MFRRKAKSADEAAELSGDGDIMAEATATLAHAAPEDWAEIHFTMHYDAPGTASYQMSVTDSEGAAADAFAPDEIVPIIDKLRERQAARTGNRWGKVNATVVRDAPTGRVDFNFKFE